MSEMKKQETKYGKQWYGMVILLTREKSIQLTLTSICLKFILYKIYFEIN